MALLVENSNFTVKAYDTPTPHHSRENGGHIVITPKMEVEHRYDLPVEDAQELMALSMVVGEAFTNVMQKQGFKVARINFQDNGNWAYKSPETKNQLHVHLYMRIWDEKHPDNSELFQAFPDALVFPDRSTGYYDKFEPLNGEECEMIRDEILRIAELDKYTELNLFKSS